MMRWVSATALAILVAVPSLAAGQVSVQGSVLVGRAEHRIVDAGTLVAASGTLFGGALAVTLGERFQIRGEALGGQLTTGAAPSLDDHDVAEAQIFGGMNVRPWLILETGLGFRNFSNALARQHWTTWRIGAEARVPLGFESVTAVLRGYWMPVVAVSGLSKPDVAPALGVGLDWRGRRLGVSAQYTFERYDFPPSNGAQRLEELSTLRVRVGMWWPPTGRAKRSA
ncbi:MAG TPA: hypothetical protein VEK83_03385 [Gemmatimonadales bacterium]|nr:hypothetical protein [Gemmatimonadales bacterium]